MISDPNQSIAVKILGEYLKSRGLGPFAKTRSKARKRKTLVKRDIVYKNVKQRGQM